MREATSRDARTALLVAAAASFACALAFATARRGHPTPSYLALDALLSFGFAAALLAIPRLRGLGIAPILALWAAAHGLVLEGWITALGYGLVGLALLPLFRPATPSPLVPALALCLALGVSLMLTHHLTHRIGFPVRGEAMRLVAEVAAFALVLGAQLAWSRIRTRLPHAPTERALALLGMAICFVLVPLTSRTGLGESRSLEPGPAADATLPGVIVLVLDTVRADRMSVYGYERDTTPALRAFVEASDRAVVYPIAFATGSWTVPSHASLLTGLLPSQHGAHYHPERHAGNLAFVSQSIRAEQTLPERLAARGYRTAAVLANPLLFRIRGLERGFEAFFQPDHPEPLLTIGEGLRSRFLPELMPFDAAPRAGVVNEAVLRVAGAAGSAPLFLLANYMDVHTPYWPPSPLAGAFSGDVPLGERLRWLTQDYRTVASERRMEREGTLYDEALLALDAALGALLAELEERGVLERSWLFITSDHGHSFGEHRVIEHGSSIYNHQVRIPLIVQPPRGVSLPPSDAPVGLLDVAATIAAIADLSPTREGRDLRLAGPARPVPIEFFGAPDERLRRFAAPARGVALGNAKLIEVEGRRVLFDLRSDPDETENLARARPERAAALAEKLPPLRAVDPRGKPGASPAGPPALADDDRRALEALGYLE